MNLRRVKQGAKITLFNGIYMILLGLYYIIFAEYNMKLNFDAFSELWGFFSKYNQNVANLFIYFSIITGVLLISLGIFVIYLSNAIIRRKEKITWVILFLAGIIGWAGLLSVSILFKNTVQIVAVFIGWFMFVLGMLIPIDYYITKNYSEY